MVCASFLPHSLSTLAKILLESSTLGFTIRATEHSSVLATHSLRMIQCVWISGLLELLTIRGVAILVGLGYPNTKH